MLLLQPGPSGHGELGVTSCHRVLSSCFAILQNTRDSFYILTLTCSPGDGKSPVGADETLGGVQGSATLDSRIAACATRGGGVLLKLIGRLLKLPHDSSYRYWVTSCIQKWAQASRLTPLPHHSPTCLPLALRLDFAFWFRSLARGVLACLLSLADATLAGLMRHEAQASAAMRQCLAVKAFDSELTSA